MQRILAPRALALALSLAVMGSWAAPRPQAPLPAHLQAATVQADAGALALAERIVATGNHQVGGQPRSFAIVDKPHAAVSVFDAQGQLLATSPVLLGLAVGDHTVPGIADKPLRLIKPEERTTPAGRFEVRGGLNADTHDVVWVDYDSAVSMHRVRNVMNKDRRLERLASPGIEDNRISFGCINVPADFYDRWIKPHFSDAQGVVYVTPDVEPMAAVFDFLNAPAPARVAAP